MKIFESGLKIGLMGGIGYAFGKYMQSDPKLCATIWIVADISYLILKKTGFPNLLATTTSLALLNYLSVTKGMIPDHLKSKLIVIAAFSFSSGVIDGFVNGIKRPLAERARPIQPTPTNSF